MSRAWFYTTVKRIFIQDKLMIVIGLHCIIRAVQYLWPYCIMYCI